MISQGPSICIFSKENGQEMLASWLFAQYLVSNEVQLGYAETEGYVPVPLKAQQSPEYQEYLSRIGEDNNEHYNIKILASQLLMAHTGDTFVTPVFNGSASLRSAAGQLIENVTKGARRKEEMNDAYIEKQYHDVSSLYRLDQIKVTAAGTEETDGETEAVKEKPFAWSDLPGISQALLIGLPCAWILIAGLAVFRSKKARQK
jgi:multiple sugar transport system substrate-binding protein